MNPHVIRSGVMGILDGLVSTLALLLGVYAAGISTRGVILAAVVAAIAGACSMGANEVVSMFAFNNKAETEHARPYLVGLSSLVAFLVGSTIVILPFALGLNVQSVAFLGAFELWFLGYMSVWNPETDAFWAGWRTLLLGAGACLLSVLLGHLVGGVVG